MAIDLRLKGFGGQFLVEFPSGAQNHSLSSATPLTITPPAGKRLRLDSLFGGVDFPNTTVTIGGTVVISNRQLSSSFGSGSSGEFIVSHGVAGVIATQPSNTVQPLLAFEPDQSIVISTTSAVTATIRYSYSWGE